MNMLKSFYKDTQYILFAHHHNLMLFEFFAWRQRNIQFSVKQTALPLLK